MEHKESVTTKSFCTQVTLRNLLPPPHLAEHSVNGPVFQLVGHGVVPHDFVKGGCVFGSHPVVGVLVAVSMHTGGCVRFWEPTPPIDEAQAFVHTV